MTVLAVAAMSARMMAEAAKSEGFEVIALDLFGDEDTLRASSLWLPIGEPAGLGLDPARVMSSLQSLARRGDVLGWVAGGGFECLPDLLERGAAVLRLLGTEPHAVRRVREPTGFFGFLSAQGIAHPEVRMARPQDPGGWLLKNARGCGGWHIRRVGEDEREPPAEHHYFQRETSGTPMSATFIANGRDACLLGFNELIVHRIGARPFVYCGAVGPVPLSVEVASRLVAALRDLAAEYSLRGLGSLDFMLDGDETAVLEINPRPPASMALYAGCAEQGLMAAHLRACLNGELPRWVPEDCDVVTGIEIVFARRPLLLTDEAALILAMRPDVHDLPRAGAGFEAGDPVCSIAAEGANARHVMSQLEAASEGLLHDLENAT